MSAQTFTDLGVSKQVTDALARRQIIKPFAVQKLVIAEILNGCDVLAQSPTGSGKTLAFGVPIVDLIKQEQQRPAALILAPTRELACQIVDELEDVARSRALKVAVVHGGVALHGQAKKAAKAHIVVATPGRLEDLLDRRAFNLKNVGLLVLDEADRMLDMGFKPAVDRIVALTSKNRQTLFFSATLEGKVGRLADAYTHNAKRHIHKPPSNISKTTHKFVHVQFGGKLDALVTELEKAEHGRTLIFVRTKRGADRLKRTLRDRKLNADALHGDLSQVRRAKALARFKEGAVDTLVATDVAARGIDVVDIHHVINYDAPQNRDAYIHRIGRTGRAGNSGTGTSLVVIDQFREMRRIATGLGLKKEFEADLKKGSNRNGRKSRNGRPRGRRPIKR